jgi:hypothetical protein
MSRGLYGQKYSGYFADSFTFFDTAAYIGSESTFTSINIDDEGSTYSYKWYGFIIPLVTGTYTFQTISDDASYVYVDETQVVNNGGIHPAITKTGTINLNAGTRYLIKIYFGENAGSASMNFSWSGGTQTSLTTDLTTDVLQFYPQSDTLLPINYGLVGWYKGEAWNGTSWPDLSGNGNHCTDIKGTINKAGNYIYGGTGDGLQFPATILPSTYTLFHVARYNGSSKGRIFDGVGSNWLSGFYSSKTGVAFHDGWLTSDGATNFPVDEILISSDQKALYRGNGIDLTTLTVTGYNKQLSINYGYFTGITYNQTSDWAVWEVIVYDRELSLEEIKFVESYLSHYIHPYTNPVVPRGVNYFNPRDIVFYKQTGYYTKINQMTGNTTNMPGFGDVVASASSNYNNIEDQWKAFNGTPLSDYWHSETRYSNGTYTGSASLGGYPGEWLKIEFPVAVFLNYSVLYARYIPNDWTKRLVKTGYLLASNDNTNWSVVQYINRTSEAYTETSFVLVDKYIQKPFKYYAVVATELFAFAGVDSIQISEWYMDVKVPEFQISNPLYPYDYVFYYGLQTYLDANNTQSYPGTGDTWYDISGNGRHGTWTSGASFNAGGYFNTTSVCTGPASNSFGITNTSGYTIFITWYQIGLTEASAFKFMKDGSGSANRGIFSHCTWSNQNIYFDQGGCCNADTRLNVACPNSRGTWHTTAFVRETGSSTRRIYIDGSLAATNTAAAANIDLNSSAVYYVGDDYYGAGWNARIKCFLAYNRGLSATEIAQLHAKFI